MAFRTGDARECAGWQGFEQAVHAFVRRQTANEQHTPTHSSGVWRKPLCIGTAVNDARPVRWCVQLTRRVGGDWEEEVEEAREQAAPHAASQTVVRHGERLPPEATRDRSHPAWEAAHMMRMDQRRAA
jgi:hypothetical protein